MCPRSQVLLLLLAASHGCAHAATATSDVCQEPDVFSALQQGMPSVVASDHIDTASGTIPKIVHHIYKYEPGIEGPWPSLIWQQSFTAWKIHFPEPAFNHIFWTDDKVNSFVEKNCTKYSNAFLEERRSIVRADFERYCILWKLGGIYADLDYEPMQPFYSDLVPGKVNLVQSPYKSESMQNSLMASPPGHIYWEQLMDKALKSMSSQNVLAAAGPQLMDSLQMTHEISMVHQLPCNEFQRSTKWATDWSEKAAMLMKHCKPLRADDRDDAGLKGIHWGTSSYSHVNDQINFMARTTSSEVDSKNDNLMRLFHDFHKGSKKGATLR